MSRPLRFRVWDTEKLKWLDNGYLRAKDGDIQLYQYDSWEKAWTTCIQHDQLIAEQFTGLTDSNGREIWEGDIVQFTIGSGIDFDNFRTQTSVVTYDTISASFLLSAPWGGKAWYSMLDLRHTAEVVGHIHDREAHDRFFGVARA